LRTNARHRGEKTLFTAFGFADSSLLIEANARHLRTPALRFADYRCH